MTQRIKLTHKTLVESFFLLLFAVKVVFIHRKCLLTSCTFIWNDARAVQFKNVRFVKSKISKGRANFKENQMAIGLIKYHSLKCL